MELLIFLTTGLIRFAAALVVIANWFSEDIPLPSITITNKKILNKIKKLPVKPVTAATLKFKPVKMPADPIP